jgi:two-component system chemotaxis response regulator CheB
VPVVVIAASTGGPAALAQLVPQLPPDLGAALVIVQHMPAGFTRPFADRLARASALGVAEATAGAALAAGRVLVAPAGQHLRLDRREGALPVVRLEQAPPRWGVRPSADVLFESAAEVAGPACIGVVLTGMGRDGVAGLRAIRAAGGAALIQDAATAAVDGMPGAARAEVGADRVCALEAMPEALVTLVRRLQEGRRAA